MILPACTIFLGAFLLFQLQPLMGKYLLPWFGGGPGVWTACLLFFQSLLLGGYAYAHWLTTRLPVRRQAVVHGALLLLSLAFLPVRPAESWQPDGTDDPLSGILLALAATVGLPYFVLSATGPLLQRWLSLGQPTASPYRLYALSNAGSLLALLSFPFVFEPLASRSVLSLGWSAGFVIFAGLCAACSWRVRGLPAAPEDRGQKTEDSQAPASSLPQTPDAKSQNPNPDPQTPDPRPQTPTSDRLLWFALPATASLLLVAVTNKVSLDLAAVPFLWVLPLAAYLLTFILSFDHPRWYSRQGQSALLGVGSLATVHCLGHPALALTVQVGAYVLTLFAGCMVAHGELHRLRPAPARLTEFYLTIAAGGAAGSTFVGLLAPRLFSDFYELPLGLVLLLHLVAAVSLRERSRSLAVGSAIGLLAGTLFIPALSARTGFGLTSWLQSWASALLGFFVQHTLAIGAVLLLVFVALHRGWRVGAGPWQRRMSLAPILLSLLFGVLYLVQLRQTGGAVFAAARNFYGAYKLRVYHAADPLTRFILLSHGGTTHGLQFSHPETSGWPTSYYAPTSGVGRVLDDTAGPPRRIGVVGLGAGSLAVYGRRGDLIRFYEIDPAIIAVAQTHFTFLRHSPARTEIVPGDARLELEAEWRRGEAGRFDVLVLDAFSGDAIPVHLLTREAMALYLRHLRPGGILAFHISNRHLDLRPVVAGLARGQGLHFANIHDAVAEQDWWLYNSTWMLVTADPTRLEPAQLKTLALDPADSLLRTVHWTDDHASLLEVLK